MTNYPIPQSVDFSGEWFLPQGQSASRVAGSLSWSSTRASLKLHESFTPLRGTVYGGEMRSYPAVHGTTVDSKLITMLDASAGITGINFGPGGFRESETLISSWLVIGAHVAADTHYSEVRVRIPGLQIWIGKSGVTQTFVGKTHNTNPSIVYYIEELPEEEMVIPTLSATLGWGIDRRLGGDLLSDISVKTSACMRIRPAEPKILKWYMEQLSKATTLLSFLAGSPMSPDHISAKVALSGTDVEVLVALRQSEYCRCKNPYDFYMLRNDMDADLSAVVSKWFEIYDSIAMPSQLALSVFNSKDLWLHVEFLSLMHALEGFHRATMPGTYTTDEAYEAVRTALVSAIPLSVSSDHRTSLKSRVRYGNEHSLRKRLNALVTRLPVELRRKILGGQGQVPQSWVDTRNYYTHWDQNSGAAVLDGLGMHRAGVRMRHLLRALYLDLVGIPRTAIDKALEKACNESQYLIQLNAEEHRESHPGSEVGAIMRIDVKDPRSPDEAAS